MSDSSSEERRPPPALPPPPWVLVGLRGSGKTSVGRALAARSRRAFVDLDAALERRSGRTIAELLAAGEMRAREADALQATLELLCLGTPRAAVLATGGGAVLDPHSRRLLGALPTVYLEVPASVAAARVEQDPRERPALVPGGPLVEAEAVLAEREELYREVATHIVDGALPLEDVVELCLSLLEG